MAKQLPANAQTQAGVTSTTANRNQLGSTENCLLGWATSISFSPPARRRGDVRDGASHGPQTDRGHLHQCWRASLALHSLHSVEIKLMHLCPSMKCLETPGKADVASQYSKGPSIPAPHRSNGDRACKVSAPSRLERKGKGHELPKAKALTFVPGGLGHRR